MATSSRKDSATSRPKSKVKKQRCQCCQRPPSSGLLCICNGENLRECRSCFDDVCQQCRQKGLCYPCRIKNNPKTGSEAALGQLNDQQLQMILQKLHFDKMAYRKWDKENMVLQIVKRCNISLLEDSEKDDPPALIELKPRPMSEIRQSRPFEDPPAIPQTAKTTENITNIPPEVTGSKKNPPKQEEPKLQQTFQTPPQPPTLQLEPEDLGKSELNLYDTPIRTIALEDIQNREDIEHFDVRELRCLLQTYGKDDGTMDKSELIEEVVQLWHREIEAGATLAISAMDEKTVPNADHHQKETRNEETSSDESHTDPIKVDQEPSHFAHSSEVAGSQLREDRTYDEKLKNTIMEFQEYNRPISVKVEDEDVDDQLLDQQTSQGDFTENFLEVSIPTAHNEANLLRDYLMANVPVDNQRDDSSQEGSENSQDQFHQDLTKADSTDNDDDREDRFTVDIVSDTACNSFVYHQPLQDVSNSAEIQENSSYDIDHREELDQVPNEHTSQETTSESLETGAMTFVEMTSINAADIANRKQPMSTVIQDDNLTSSKWQTTEDPEEVTAIVESRAETHQSFEILKLISQLPPVPPPPPPTPFNAEEFPLDAITISDIHQMTKEQLQDILKRNGVLDNGEDDEKNLVIEIWQKRNASWDVGSAPVIAERQMSTVSNVSEVDSELEKLLTLPSENLAIDDVFQSLQKLENNAEFFEARLVTSSSNDDNVPTEGTESELKLPIIERQSYIEQSLTDLLENGQDWRRSNESLDIETEFQMSLKPAPEVVSVTLKRSSILDEVKPALERESVDSEIDQSESTKPAIWKAAEKKFEVEIRETHETASNVGYRSSWISYLGSIPESHVDTMEEFKLRAILRAFGQTTKDLWMREDLIKEVKQRWRELRQGSLERKSTGIDERYVQDIRRQPSTTSLSSIQDVSLETITSDNEIESLTTRTLQAILKTYGVPMDRIVIRKDYIREVKKLWEKVKTLQERDFHIEIVTAASKKSPAVQATINAPAENLAEAAAATSKIIPNEGNWQKTAAENENKRIKHEDTRKVPVIIKDKDKTDEPTQEILNAHPKVSTAELTQSLNSQDLSTIGSLSDISMADKIDQLTIRQIKSILRKHSVAHDTCHEKHELVSKLKQLWHDNKKKEGCAIPTDEQCRICMTNAIDSVLIECGHMATCTSCGKQIRECPICRRYVDQVVRVFKAEPTNNSTGPVTIPKDDVCVICWKKPINSVFLYCGHMTTCYDCGSSRRECPVCRQYATRVLCTYQV